MSDDVERLAAVVEEVLKALLCAEDVGGSKVICGVERDRLWQLRDQLVQRQESKGVALPTPAPAAPPEAEAEAILRRKEVRQPCSGKRGDGPWVLVEPAIYLGVTERDTVLAALAAATARADAFQKALHTEREGHAKAEALWLEAAKMQRERADAAQAEAERLRVDGDRRVEAMREASMKAECRGCAADLAVVDGASIGYPGVPMHDYPSEDGPFRSSCMAWRIRALPATPAPGPRAAVDATGRDAAASASSSPSPSPVRLSPVCSIEPSGERVLLKNTKC